MATDSGVLPGIMNADLHDDPRVIRAQLQALESRIQSFGDLENREESLIRDQAKAQAEHQEVVARVQPEINILSQLQPPLTEAKQRQLNGLHSEVVQSQAKIDQVASDLAKVRSDKEVLTHLYESRERRRFQLEQSLAKVKEPAPSAASVADVSEPASPISASSAAVDNELRDLRALGYSDEESEEMTPAQRRQVINSGIYASGKAPLLQSSPSSSLYSDSRYDRVTNYVGENRGWLGIVLLILVIIAVLVLQPWKWFAMTPAQTSTQPASVAAPAQAAVAGVKTLLIDIPGVALVNPDELPMVAVDKTTGKSTYNAKAQVVDTAGKPVAGAKVSVQGNTYTTGSDGWAYFPLTFSSTNPVSEKQTLKIDAGGQIKEYQIWAARFLDNSVSQAALNKDQVVKTNATDPRFRKALESAGVSPENLVGIDVGTSDGKTSMISMDTSGNVSNGGVVPAGQPVWVLSYRMADESLKKVYINPICVNVFTPAPAPTPVSSRRNISIATALSASNVTIGASVYDTAVFSGITTSPTGTVTYFVYAGSTCTGVSVFSSTKMIVNGAIPNSDTFTFNTAGVYNWQAIYSGDANYNVAVSPCGTETLIVTAPGNGFVPPTTTPAPTPAPTPVPTPVPTKNPSNAPTPPTPPPASQPPAPTYTPPPPVGNSITITSQSSCGTGCEEIHWSAPNSVRAAILYGLTGNSMTNTRSATGSSSDWVVQLTNLDSGKSYTFTVAVWYADNTQNRTNGSFTAP